MRFENPELLHLLWFLPVLILFLFYRRKRLRKKINDFLEPELQKHLIGGFSRRRLFFKDALLVAAFGLMLFSIARPQWGFEWQDVKKRGIDVLVAIDVSKSMLAQDVKPNRLERTKLAVLDLVEKLKGDRIGLIAFAGDAFLTCPLTSDYSGFGLSLNDLNVGTIPRGGTNIGLAIQEALSTYEEQATEKQSLIIVTDGDNLEGEPLQQAKKAAEKGIVIHVIGIGSPEGELIQIQNQQGQMSFLKDPDGNFVKTRLNEALLTSIVEQTNGIYVRASGAQFGFEWIYDQALSKKEKKDFESKRQKKYFDRYYIFLSLGIFCLIVSMCLSKRSRRAVPVLSFLVLSLTSVSSVCANSGEWVESYNQGVSLYKEEKFFEARDKFLESLLSDDQELQQKANYNLGNTYMKMANVLLEEDLDEAVQNVQKAADQFESALEKNPKNQNAIANLEHAKKVLEGLKQVQKQQENENSRGEPNSEKESKEGERADQKEQGDGRESENADKSKESEDSDQLQESKDSDQSAESDKAQDSQASDQGQNSQASGSQSSDQSQDDGQFSDENQETGQAQSEQDQGNDDDDSNQAQGNAEESGEKSEERQENEESEESGGEKNASVNGNSQQNPYNENSEGQQTYRRDELTPEEAKMLLQKFEQTEQPKEMLNFYQPKSKDRRIKYKDW